VVTDKAERVKNFHAMTVDALAELVGAAGLERPGDITANHLMVRNASGVAVPLSSVLPTVPEDALLDEAQLAILPEPFCSQWKSAVAASFERRVAV
jgi:hypothetical protein